MNLFGDKHPHNARDHDDDDAKHNAKTRENEDTKDREEINVNNYDVHAHHDDESNPTYQLCYWGCPGWKRGWYHAWSQLQCCQEQGH